MESRTAGQVMGTMHMHSGFQSWTSTHSLKIIQFFLLFILSPWRPPPAVRFSDVDSVVLERGRGIRISLVSFK